MAGQVAQLAAEVLPTGGRSLRVAIVGGGCAGVTTCRLFRDAGHIPKLFEAGIEVGGIWAPEPTNRVTYRGLVTNLPTPVMQSPDLDFGINLPSYVQSRDLGEYIAQYADHFALRPFMEFEARVTRVRALSRSSSNENDSVSWEVQWNGRGEARKGEFDAVVVATGHYNDPYMPKIPGQEAWLADAVAPGDRGVSHSQGYDDPEAFKGRSVLVVGGRSSGVDVARELRAFASWVYVLDKSCTEVTTVGQCTHLPLGAEVCPDGHMRVQGILAPGHPIDHIVLATGYKYIYPFLDSQDIGLEFGPDERYVSPLYLHVLHARLPSLCFIGVPLAVPCPIPLFEAQARFAAAFLRGDATAAATKATREAWVAARRESVGERLQDMHFLGGSSWDYMRQLSRMAGVTGAEFDAYASRLALVSEVYGDRCEKRPKLPWDDDTYRKYEYAVDWEAGTWQVASPAEE